jgi:hypothetical protein
MKHTPAPWEVSTDRGQHAVISGKRVMAYTGAVGALDNEESIANAALIAAAPELLDALQELLKETGINGTYATKALAAIRKATGAQA